MKTFLLIDAGGTKTSVHQYELSKKIFQPIRSKTYYNKEFKDFYSLLEEYLMEFSFEFAAVAIAAAGVIKNNQVKLTNLDWEISKPILLNKFFPYLDKENLILLNDIEASAYYPPSAQGQNTLVEISSSKNPAVQGTYSVISVGTGLGTAYATCHKSSGEYLVSPAEAGHANFAPASSEQWDLYAHFRRKLPIDQAISNEFFLSGEGLIRIYLYLIQEKNICSDQSFFNSSTYDIRDLAEKGDKTALEAVRIFFEILAGVSMNIALTLVPARGIFFSGGMITSFSKFLDKEHFSYTFCRNTKMKDLLEKIPLYIIQSPDTPILGLLEYLQKKGS